MHFKRTVTELTSWALQCAAPLTTFNPNSWGDSTKVCCQWSCPIGRLLFLCRRQKIKLWGLTLLIQHSSAWPGWLSPINWPASAISWHPLPFSTSVPHIFSPLHPMEFNRRLSLPIFAELHFSNRRLDCTAWKLLRVFTFCYVQVKNVRH